MSQYTSVVVVAADALAVQCALAGVHVDVVDRPADAEGAIAEWLDKDVELLVVGESLRMGLSEPFLERLRRRRNKPLVVFCPTFEREEAQVDAYLSSVLKPVIGYEIRLD